MASTMLESVSLRGQVADERPVDLELVDGKPLEVGERRVARSEVVEREVHPHLVEARQHLDRPVRVEHEHGLGDLDPEEPRLEPAAVELGGDRARKVEVDQVADRQVDGHREVEPRSRHSRHCSARYAAHGA